jgi:hypothetical protein
MPTSIGLMLTLTISRDPFHWCQTSQVRSKYNDLVAEDARGLTKWTRVGLEICDMLPTSWVKLRS